MNFLSKIFGKKSSASQAMDDEKSCCKNGQGECCKETEHECEVGASSCEKNVENILEMAQNHGRLEHSCDGTCSNEGNKCCKEEGDNSSCCH